MKSKKRVNSMRKGSGFERTVCRQLSLWFSRGKNEDLFYRTAGSGARSTARAKKGKTTANSAGDIGYLDAAGKPLIEAITFELKCGYNNIDTTSLIDTAPRRKRPQLLEFIEQAVDSAKNAQSKYWAVIHKRNGKQALIQFPMSMWQQIQELFVNRSNLQITYVSADVHEIVSMPFATFLEIVPPELFGAEK
jgi:hypothetical protein